MPVTFHTTGGTKRLIPEPFVNISKTFDKSGSGEILGVRYVITLTGTLLHDRGSPNSSGAFGADATETITPDNEYKSIQNKQKAISNLFSKKNEGGELHVQGPDASTVGFKCRCRIVSVDFPSHTPGNPQISTYTVTLEADQLLGPAGQGDDEEDWQRLEKWLVSSASENWSISENEGGKVITIIGTGAVTKVEKTYTLTRSLSATGKGKFKITPAADGLKGDGFSTKYDETDKEGEAWQQARGFVYEIIKYGNTFLNDETYEGERDLNGINIPANYEGFNYVRSETIDELAGTFSATENWILLPSGHSSVTETVETSISQSQDTGILKVTINGSIQGLGTENTDETLPGDEAADTLVDFEEKYVNAKARFDALEGGLYLVAQGLLRESAALSQVTLNPSPMSKTIGKNPHTGIITYSLEFDNRLSFAIPFVMSETIAISDTYPGHVAAVTQVIGRSIGPVLQSVGTQTKWQRSLSISCVVGTSFSICMGAKDGGGDLIDPQPNNFEDCNSAHTPGTWGGGGSNPVGNPATDFYGGAIAAKPSQNAVQRTAIAAIISKFNPATAPAATATGALLNVFFTETPQESWNPRTGAWTYTVSWVYEPSRTYQFITTGPNAPYPGAYI